MTITYEWRGEFENTAVNVLHAEGFGHDAAEIDWHTRVHSHSLGWVCARDDAGDLVGFVNVVGDGGAHAFIIDTVIAERLRHHGVGTGLIAAAATHARVAGCQWLHVDFEEHLSAFYFQACGFRPTMAGLIALAGEAAQPPPDDAGPSVEG